MDHSGPRRPHPPPSQPAVARVTPMVPEVSLFFGPAQHHAGYPAVRPNPAGTNSNRPEMMEQYRPPVAYSGINSTNSSALLTPQRPPSPHRPVYQGMVAPHPDFSRLFDSSLSFCDPTGGMVRRANPVMSTLDPSSGQRIYFTDHVEPRLEQSSGQTSDDPTRYLEKQSRNRPSITETETVKQTRVQNYYQPTAEQGNLPRNFRHGMETFATNAASTNNPVDPSAGNGVPSVEAPQASTINSSPWSRGADPATTASLPNSLPPDIVRVLNWQNEQLKLLQDQVRQLLESSPQAAVPAAAGGGRGQDGNSTADSLRNRIRAAETQTSICDGQFNTRTDVSRGQQQGGGRELGDVTTTSCAATNTSTLWPDIQKGLEKLQHIVEEEEEEEERDRDADINPDTVQVNRSEGSGSRSPPPSMYIDLPDFASECSPDLRRPQEDQERAPSHNNHPPGGPRHRQQHQGETVSWESPVLGESVSMYEGGSSSSGGLEEEAREVYEGILSQVKRLLGSDSGASQHLSHDEEPELRPDTNPQHEDPTSVATPAAMATLNRLRQLGVSFIQPEELMLPRRPSAPPVQPAAAATSAAGPPPPAGAALYNSMFLPRAACPSQSVWNSAASPDTSLEINSLALKYLNDSQLSRLAEQHGRVQRPAADDCGGNGVAAAAAGVGKSAAAAAGGLLSMDGRVDMSMASHQFLARHGLAGSVVQDDELEVTPTRGPVSNPATTNNNNITPTTSREPLRALENRRGGSGVPLLRGTAQLNQRFIQQPQETRSAAVGPPPQWPPTCGTGGQAAPPILKVFNNPRQQAEPWTRDAAPQYKSKQQDVVVHDTENRFQPQQQQQQQQQQYPFMPQQQQQQQQEARPSDLRNRVLDITAIKQQPKLL